MTLSQGERQAKGTKSEGNIARHCSFVPPYLLRRLAGRAVFAPTRAGCERTLELDARLRSRREDPFVRLAGTAAAEAAASRVVHTANNTETLPGEVVRTDGDPPVGDAAVDEAFESSGQVLQLFAEQFGRRSVDGIGGTLSITVHFGLNYDNAFWDGTQLVFGDGDGVIFERFTKPMDVMAHEFTHGVVQFTAGLAYVNQSGALNESVSDVFAAMAKQFTRGHTAEQADWLIGEGLFRPAVNGRALRSMREPGTAYDDPQIGRDPQVGSMADYVETTDDNGGVHINSGIPNRAFALAAVDVGGFSWERVGQVWYDALTAGEVPARSSFATFAQATLSSATRLFPEDPALADKIRTAWLTVGVLSDVGLLAESDKSEGGSSRPAATVAVRRSGGYAGTVRTGELDLDGDPEGPEVRRLLRLIQVQQISASPPAPDRFSYAVRHGGWQVVVSEQDLTPELRRVVQIVLSRARRAEPGAEFG